MVRVKLEEAGLEPEVLGMDEFPAVFRARASKFRLFRIQRRPRSDGAALADHGSVA